MVVLMVAADVTAAGVVVVLVLGVGAGAGRLF